MLVVSVIALLGPSRARADEVAPAAPASPAIDKPAEPAKPSPIAQREPYYPVAITISPLSFFQTRFSANAEVMLARHHGLSFSGFVQLYDRDFFLVKQASTAFGGEAGYHYYTGTRGADGFWFGPSVLFGRENVRREDFELIESSGVVALGGAFDLGGQLVHRGGFTIGCGAGLGYLASLAGRGEIADAIRADRLMLRINFQLGWSF